MRAVACAVIGSLAAACGGTPVARSDAGSRDPIVVIGAGIGGLAAAVEAASRGAPVVVLDRWSVFGGHAVVSGGGVTMIGTSTQVAAGVRDEPAVAIDDFLAWGGDADPSWVRRYAGESRAQVHDWLIAMGVVFEGLAQLPGNRVARYHRTRDRGLGLVVPLFRNAVALGVRFEWNLDAVDLVIDDGGRVTGVVTRRVRDGKQGRWPASAVILATGGFQSNLAMVRANWPAGQPQPARILAGSGRNSLGDGLRLAERAGAALTRLDHQWNYATGVPDPRFPGSDRGLNVEVPQAIRVNTLGERFADESAAIKALVPALIAQPGGMCWTILDADGISSLAVSGPEWADRSRVERDILSNPELAVRADDLAALARAAGLPVDALARSVEQHAGSGAGFAIARPPFIAIRMYVLARKSMGGVAVDGDARVVDSRGRPIRGLYAAGEVAGFGGINGRAALEGTFLGPSVLMGRVAAEHAAAENGWQGRSRPARQIAAPHAAGTFDGRECTRCHPLAELTAERPGWVHVAAAHRRVRDEAVRCADCHAELYPYRKSAHAIDPLAQSATCARCHLPPPPP